MSGYVASARIRAVSPRFVVMDGGATLESPAHGLSMAGLAPAVEDLVTTATAAGRVASRIGERFAAFGARWSQLTWYLFDPESWR
jgi:hypothetical protein